MSNKKMLLLVGVLMAAAFILTACAGPAGPEGPAGPAGPAGPEGPAGTSATTADLTCAECHNDTDVIAGKVNSWAGSLHGSGTATAYAGGRKGCSGCHSGGGFSERMVAGITNPDEFETTYANPSRPDCRACHQVHTTYTGTDWALETTAAVPMYAFEGVTFDGGEGNLCANCHQARRPIADAVDGIIEVTSTHWGPHHGPQSNMLLGTGGYGVEGKPSAHYSMVEDTCVACHMGEGQSHSFTPNVSACTGCHADTKNFDINGVQTEVEEKLAELAAKLTAAGLLDEKGTIVVGKYPEAQAGALWNFIYVEHEDKSMGVHNSAYTNALLDAALAVFP